MSAALTISQPQSLSSPQLIPEETCRRFKVCVTEVRGTDVVAVAVNSFGENVLREFLARHRFNLQIRRVSAQEVDGLINLHYPQNAQRKDDGDGAGRGTGRLFENFTGKIAPVSPPEPLQKVSQQGDLRTIVQLIFEEAIQLGASDVRITRNARSETLDVFFIVNDIQKRIHAWDCSTEAWNWFAVNLLRMAGVRDEGLMTKQHSGQITSSVTGRSVEVRLMAMPTTDHGSHSEKTHLMFTLRLQYASAKRFDWMKIGYFDWEREKLFRLANRRSGLVLLIGQMGSGKNGTAGALLGEMLTRNPGKRILTIEKPIEMRIDGVQQVEVPPDKAPEEYLSGALRSAVEVIFCAEINSEQMAKAVNQSALTGHLTITTLHAANPFQVGRRLAGFGVGHMDLSETLAAVVYQTLAVNLCPHCRRPHPNWRSDFESAGQEGEIYDFLQALRHWRVPTTLDAAYEIFLETRGRERWASLSESERRDRLQYWSDAPWGERQSLIELGRENGPGFERWREEEGMHSYVFTPYMAEGCQKCHMTGEAGRSAIPEIWDPTPFRTLLSEAQTTPAQLRQAALKRGHVTLAKAGLARVISGAIGLESYFKSCGPLDLEYEGIVVENDGFTASASRPLQLN
jgi:type II secretory ATPase GspE/PulE/Tfp pilus assembly ATPase PilB-like protein